MLFYMLLEIYICEYCRKEFIVDCIFIVHFYRAMYQEFLQVHILTILQFWGKSKHPLLTMEQVIVQLNYWYHTIENKAYLPGFFICLYILSVVQSWEKK